MLTSSGLSTRNCGVTLAAGVSTAVHARARSASDIPRRQRLIPAAEPPAAAASAGGLDVEPPAAAPALGFEEKESWVDKGPGPPPSRWRDTLSRPRRGLVFPEGLGDNRAADDRHEVLEALASFYEFLRSNLTTFPDLRGERDFLSPFDEGNKRNTILAVLREASGGKIRVSFCRCKLDFPPRWCRRIA